jgi:VanZ family protein
MKRLRLLSAVLWTVIILILCWTPQIYFPVDEGLDSWKIRLQLDKVVHVGIFAVFSVLWLRALPAGKKTFLLVGVAGLALAALTEVVQNVPIIQREGEVEDAAADFVGVLLGFPVFLWLEGALKHRKKQPANRLDVTSAPSKTT